MSRFCLLPNLNHTLLSSMDPKRLLSMPKLGCWACRSTKKTYQLAWQVLMFCSFLTTLQTASIEAIGQMSNQKAVLHQGGTQMVGSNYPNGGKQIPKWWGATIQMVRSYYTRGAKLLPKWCEATIQMVGSYYTRGAKLLYKRCEATP